MPLRVASTEGLGGISLIGQWDEGDLVWSPWDRDDVSNPEFSRLGDDLAVHRETLCGPERLNISSISLGAKGRVHSRHTLVRKPDVVVGCAAEGDAATHWEKDSVALLLRGSLDHEARLAILHRHDLCLAPLGRLQFCQLGGYLALILPPLLGARQRVGDDGGGKACCKPYTRGHEDLGEFHGTLLMSPRRSR